MSAQVTITQLPQAGTITGTEAVPIVQNGQTVQTTTGAIAAGRYSYDLVLDSGSSVTRILEGKFIVTGAVTT